MEAAQMSYQLGRRELGLGQFRMAMGHFDRAQGVFRAQGWHIEGDECGRRAKECWDCIAAIRRDGVTQSSDVIQIGNLYRGRGEVELAGAWYVRAGLLCRAERPEEAARLFEEGKSLGCFWGQMELWSLHDASTPECAARVARFYRDRDLLQAGIWYERAVDLVESARFFRSSLDPRGETALRRILATPHSLSKIGREMLEREFVLWMAQSGRDYREHCDARGRTAIERAFEHRLYKHAAYLITMGSPWPLSSDLTEQEHRKIGVLVDKITLLMNQLRTPPAQLVKREDWSAPIGEASFRSMVSYFFNNPWTAPLMQVIKLASLNCHRLSGREKFQPNVDHYESDNEDCEFVSNEKEFLIKILNSLPLRGYNGFYVRNTSEIYVQKDPSYIQGRLAGLIAHESTHFVACEVFGNNSLPYASTDAINKNYFSYIETQVRRQNVGEPNDRVKEVIEVGLSYNPHQELIVRIPQLIVEGYSILELRTRFPELTGYYERTFIPAVAAYAAKLQNRALDGWQT